MEVIGHHAKNFLTKFWIWGVAITLFTVAITGDRMTGFRIVYMALFLTFILVFQVYQLLLFTLVIHIFISFSVVVQNMEESYVRILDNSYTIFYDYVNSCVYLPISQHS